ncbi:hypothetical protein [Streptomyces sp. WMMB 322]|uniref:hypothetical protein n=1 Tax=Streptomyces sp. WMMB 322 TaxID=1286821 RepID=UPI0006E1839A|nr:hypothetical protein [Streptomyces sp. WMMB 322]SCK28239.1 hypothetical protein H180DRAFT_02202 [Streptomyces sp. WMMB 322]
MRKNIRRSLMVAAAASGIWALSTAGASAAELPVPSDAGSAVAGTTEKAAKAEKAEKAGEGGRGAVADTVRRATDTVKETTGTVEDVSREIRENLPSKGIPENGLPTNTLPIGDLPTGAADGVTGKLRGTDAAVPAVPADPAVPGVHDVSGHLPPRTLPALAVPGVPALPAAPGVPAVPAVPAGPSVPATGEPAGGLPAAPVRPEQLTAVLKSRPTEETVTTARNTVATVHPVIDNVSGLVPPARLVQLHARATAYQLATDAARTVDCALSTTAPFVESTYYRTEALGHGTAGDLGAFAHGVASDSAVYAHELVGTGVHGNVDRLVAHTATNVAVLITAPTKRDLTDPANVPADVPVGPVASQVPAGL